MPITALPTPPSTNDPTNFAAEADAFLGALPTWGTEATALETAVNAAETSAVSAAATATAAADAAIAVTTYLATSSSSHSATAGVKAFALDQAGLTFVTGDELVAIRRGDSSVRLKGTAAIAGQTATITIPAGGVSGTGGPFVDWLVLLSALEAISPPDAAALAIAFAIAL